MQFCDFGCGRQANFQAKHSKKWRCSENVNHCPSIKAKNAKGVIRANANKSPSDKAKTNERRRQTVKSKYGVDHVRQHADVNRKAEQTCLEKYGVKNPQQANKIRQKTAETNLTKYGASTPFESEQIQQKIKLRIYDRFGVTNPAQSEEVQNIRRIQTKNRTGYEHHMKDPEHLKYRCREYKRKTGFNNPAQNPNVREKYIATCLDKYGVEAGIFLNKGPKSQISQQWLDKTGILQENREVRIPGLGGFVDGYDPLTKTVYEFLGDFWHGNLNVYNSDNMNPVAQKTYGELFRQTINRLERLGELGYTVKFVWESDFKNGSMFSELPSKPRR